ncbi:alcohol dehydrogenase catalytic domain-containing protein [Hyphomonas chukchiensis]|uniref:Enoyl reductase (ER) domain-containing protein n=1 Tax=Hyphomonas chukchiensis TaxID=1280947 RepID=A0A062UPB3_9PROT|nr:alcohol dehydrogenase catalytic domain-containing protein [Hyphomonas chukchiensis]KCZ58683.1 hypothetical protein HY30_15875 [Hyphomonas chukchiensis]
MKALVYRGAYTIELEDVSDPSLIDDQDVIVKVELCAICGSDLHIFHGEGFVPGTGYCVGHEAVGEIVEIGRGVFNRKVGDRVMISAAPGCGACLRCVRGDTRNCLDGKQNVFGVGTGLGGCQAQGVRVPAGDFNTALIPEGVSLVQALMLTDALPTAWFGCKSADVSPGGTVAIIGAGPIGQLAVLCSFVLGASRVFVVEPNPDRRLFAEQIGAQAFAPDDAVALIEEATKGLMVDSVIEIVGTEQTIKLAIRLARRMGSVAAIGGSRLKHVAFPNRYAFSKGLTFRVGTTSVPLYWPELIPLVQAKRLTPESVVTHRMSLDQGAVAYRQLDGKLDRILKSVLSLS